MAYNPVINRAKEIGESIKEKHLTKENHESQFLEDGDLTEYIYTVFEKEKGQLDVWTQSMDYECLLTEILALLSNPKISGQLQKSYQAQAGNLILKLINFFSLIKNDNESVERYLVFHKLMRWSGSMTMDDLDKIEQNYLSEKAA